MAELFVAAASGVGRDLEAIATHAHAAPVASPFLAGVVEMQHAVPALAQALAVHGCEQGGRAVRQRSQQVFGLARLEP